MPCICKGRFTCNGTGHALNQKRPSFLDDGQDPFRGGAAEAATPPEACGLHPAAAVVGGQTAKRAARGCLHSRDRRVLVHGLQHSLGARHESRARLLGDDQFGQLLHNPAAGLLHPGLLPVLLHGLQGGLHRAVRLPDFLRLGVVHASAEERPAARALHVRGVRVVRHGVEHHLHTAPRHDGVLEVGVTGREVPEHTTAKDLNARELAMHLHSTEDALDTSTGDDIILVGGAVGRHLPEGAAAKLLHCSGARVRRHGAQRRLDASQRRHLHLAVSTARGDVAEHLAADFLQGLPVHECRHGLDEDGNTIDLQKLHDVVCIPRAEPFQGTRGRDLDAVLHGMGMHRLDQGIDAAHRNDLLLVSRTVLNNFEQRPAAGLLCGRRTHVVCHHLQTLVDAHFLSLLALRVFRAMGALLLQLATPGPRPASAGDGNAAAGRVPLEPGASLRFIGYGGRERRKRLRGLDREHPIGAHLCDCKNGWAHQMK
mmetsp:Transcript_72520/g.208130  ORF Transcript_72520/g.208130 Transcript_72520/m.208130 type:complete len:484 (-) Transcript_72520:23-1474(-)